MFGNVLFSQSEYVYFNKRYQPYGNGLWCAITNIIEVDDGYIACGPTQDTANSFWNRVGLLKINALGEITISKSFGDSISLYFTGWPGSLVKRNSQIYLAGSKQCIVLDYYVSGFVYKLSTTTDTLWTKEFKADKSTPLDTFQWFRSMNICTNGDLIFTGGFEGDELPVKIPFIRTDSFGNIIFNRYFGTSGYNEGFSLLETYDNGFAIGGYWYVPGSSIYTGDPILIKTDSIGNKQWEKNLGEEFSDNKALLCLSPEGDIIAGTTISDTSTVNNDRCRIQITKLDVNGSIIWNKKYGKSLNNNFLTKIICLDNGCILAAGEVPDIYPHRVGWLLKVNSNGDSIWYRHYSNLHGEKSENHFFDLIHTSDSGFIIGGYVYPKIPDTGIQDSWVLKLDSLGCDTPGCDPGVWIPKRFIAKEQLSVYPNPASNYVIITLPEGENYNLFVYNTHGIKQQEIKIPKYSEQVQVDVSAYSPGLYFGILRNKEKIIGNCKFVVRY